LETSFLPGRAFASPADFNAQLAEWLPRANARKVRGLDAVPAELINTDRAAMSVLPPIAPTLGFTHRARLPRDYYLRVLGNDYSIDPTVIGRMVDVHADLDTITAHCGDTIVACHPRAWTRHQTITDPTHVTTAARLRAALHTPPNSNLSAEQDDELAGLVRDLADYDARFGIDFTPDLGNQLDGEGVA
jgi:Mu transposase-like protein